MAVTEPPVRSAANSLQALTAAALVLPGLLGPPLHAAEDSLSLQYSRYEEGKRDLIDVDGGSKPLSADTIHAAGSFALRDSFRLHLNLAQDTWSGATPVTTAPLASGGNRPVLRNTAAGVVVSGASPYVNSQLRLDRALQPLTTGPDGATTVDPRRVLVMSSASPEVRNQGDLALAYEGRAAAVTLGAGLSAENDYFSRYANLGGGVDFNQKLTSVNWGTGYTRSNTDALLDADLLPYVGRSAYANQLERSEGSELLRGRLTQRSFTAGLTQVIDAASLLSVDVGLTRSSGFMANPYKVMTTIFIGNDAFSTLQQQSVQGDVRALLEQRPDERRQLAVGARYVRQIGDSDAALHADYQYSRDDWGIASHSLELAWVQPLQDWTLTPRLRYYSQQAADFYHDYLVTPQAYRSIARDAAGRELWFSEASPATVYLRSPRGDFLDAGGNLIDADALNLQPQFTGYSSALLPAHFSSDHRLAGFGALSASLTLARQFDRGFSVEAGLEYYTRASSLKHGGAGQSGFADFDFVLANVAITVDLQSTPRRLRRETAQVQAGTGHTEHMTSAEHSGHMGHRAPAGLLYAHTLAGAGEFMAGYRVSHLRQQGAMLSGTRSVGDAELVSDGCGTTLQCRYVPTAMNMSMHMLDLMYAPNERLTLMLMPQFMSMDMQVRELAGRPPAVPGIHEHNSGREHVSGTLGDTVVAALFTLRQSTSQMLHASLGVSVPTGKVNLAYRRSFGSDGGLQHFDMQTGSGTWDLVPTLTWTLMQERRHFGLQLAAVQRLEERNASGYRLGNSVQAAGWVSQPLGSWLAGSVRAVYTDRSAIRGDYSAYNAGSGPMDFPANQGGRYWDLGLGLNLSVAGSELALEWLQPLQDDVNGYQLERQGTLAASWNYGF